MKSLKTFAAALLICLLGLSVRAADPPAALGLWSTEGGKSRVEIFDCAGKLCGKIVWLKEPLDDQGKEKVDRENPDEALKGRKILGLALLSDFVAEGDSGRQWTDGRIYNPEDGQTYKCNMELQDDGKLKVRGYVGLPLFGKTQIWTPAK
jgi:uncharacterized protein (DUF2147 family)